MENPLCTDWGSRARDRLTVHSALALPAVQTAVKRDLLERAQKVTIRATVDAEQKRARAGFHPDVYFGDQGI